MPQTGLGKRNVVLISVLKVTLVSAAASNGFSVVMVCAAAEARPGKISNQNRLDNRFMRKKRGESSRPLHRELHHN